MEDIEIIVDDLTEEVSLNNTTAITEAPIDGKQYTRKDAGWDELVGAGGDMTKSVYDPTNKSADAFDYGNFDNTPTTITAQQGTDITINNAKTGITSQQSTDITTNNSKISYTDATAVGLNTAKVGITPTQASDITTNNAKTSYTDASQVATNKTNADASKIITDHISVTQAVDLDTMESNIATNNSKVGVTTEEANTINTELEAGMTGEDLVLNVLSVTTAEHGAGTPIATTLYIITDA